MPIPEAIGLGVLYLLVAAAVACAAIEDDRWPDAWSEPARWIAIGLIALLGPIIIVAFVAWWFLYGFSAGLFLSSAKK